MVIIISKGNRDNHRENKMNWKRCKVCDTVRRIEEFHVDKKNSDGHRNKCKVCVREYDKAYRAKNIEKRKKQKEVWYQKNKSKLKEYGKKYREDHKEEIGERMKVYYKDNKEKINAYTKQYHKENKEKLQIQKNAYRRNKRKIDINYRLKKNVSRAVNTAMRGTKNRRRTEELIGYPIELLKEHLEKQFIGDMSWDNYGNKENCWCMDHIIPQSFFNFFDEKEIKKCWSYRNLRPLNFIENSARKNKLDWTLIEEYNIQDLLPEKILLEDLEES